MRRLRETARAWTRSFHEACSGQEREVIVEDLRQDGATGLTDNFIAVDLGAGSPPSGTLLRARLRYDQELEKTDADVIRLK